MNKEEFKEYVDSIKESQAFKSLDDFLQLTQMPGEDIYKKIETYLSMYCARTDCKEFFQPDFDYFKRFMDSYLKQTQDVVKYTEAGRIDLANTPHLVQPFKYCNSKKRGAFFDGWIVMIDGTQYMCKLPLNQKPERSAGITSRYAMYVPLIASQISKQLGIKTAEYMIGVNAQGRQKVMSKNFLEGNEEMFHLRDDEEAIDEDFFVSHDLNLIDEQLRNRRFPQSQIESTKFDFLKQEFMAKLIGLKDQKYGNSPIITGVDEQGKKYAKLAPMLDYDFSFQIAEKIDSKTRKCDNGKTDIDSFIKQYRNYPGFGQFLTDSINRLNMEEVFRTIYEETKMPEFRDYNDPNMLEFIEFVNRNLNLARQVIERETKEREEL